MARKLTGYLLLALLCGVLIIGSFEPANFGLSPEASRIASLRDPVSCFFMLESYSQGDLNGPLAWDPALPGIAVLLGGLLFLYRALPARGDFGLKPDSASSIRLTGPAGLMPYRRKRRIPTNHKRHVL